MSQIEALVPAVVLWVFLAILFGPTMAFILTALILWLA